MKFFRRFRALFRKEKLDAEMSEEMCAHLELQAAENEKRGMAPDDARYAAQRSFGGAEQIKERARDQRAFRWLEHLGQDAGYAVRSARKNPGFTCTVVLTLALGIGATTAAFTALNALVWNTLPVRAPEELVLVSRSGTAAGPLATGTRLFSFPLYEQLRSEAPSLSSLAALSYATRAFVPTAGGNDEAEAARVGEVTGNFFQAIGVRVALGRPLGPDDDRSQDPQAVAVIGYGLWERRFASDPAVLGRTVLIDEVPVTIVGVTAAGFSGVEVGGACDLWLPLQLRRRFDPAGAPTAFRTDDNDWLRLMGRLPRAVAVAQAANEADVIYQRLVADLAQRAGARWAESPQRRLSEGRLTLLPGKGGYNESLAYLRPLLLSVAAIVTLVLAIACANVASLLLARAAVRQREFAVRLALGGGRGRLVRQVLTETIVLALAGAACGVLFARWGLDLLVSNFFPPEIVAVSGFNLNPDGRILALTTAVALVTGLAVGLAPALRFSRLDLVSALKLGGGGMGGPARQRLNRFLVVAQIAVSVCLLAGAGLFVRTVQNIRDTDRGFDRTNALRVMVQAEKNADLPRRAAIVQEMLAGLGALPGVRHVTVAEGAVRMSGGDRAKIEIDGYAPAEKENMTVPAVHVGPDFFPNMGIPLLQGRAPDARETLANDAASPGVIVISESAAKRYFGEGPALGRRIRLTGQPAPLEVVGVARDVMFNGVRQKTPVVMYVPYGRTLPRLRSFTFYVRTPDDPLRLAGDVRALVRRVVPGVPLRGPLLTIEGVLDLQMFQERAIAQVASFFSSFSLVLACVGLYGVLAYNVAQRTREIGVRMALGANRRDVLVLVVRQGLGLTLAGCVVGLAAAVILVQLAAKLLYGVTSADPLTLVATSGLLLGVALLASLLPARRATKIDPMIALRAE